MRQFFPSRMIPVLLLLPLGTLLTGCASSEADREMRMPNGYIWYCDGAGGGGTIGNYAGGVIQGLREANYDGSGEIFKWNTGMGVVPDQTLSVDAKRSRGRRLANEVVKYKKEYPGAPTTLMGLSAGTSIVLFALEAMPPGKQVDNAFLLSSSVSSTYDLTKALQHVRGNMYVFTSSNDGVLRYLVPMAGTADRKAGTTASAGIEGFRTPRSGSSATRALYEKVKHIHWSPKFEKEGNFGGHTDVVKAPFVRDYIAPLVMADDYKRKKPSSRVGMVKNPDYERWGPFREGAWVRWKGEQTYRGETSEVNVTVELVSKTEDQIVLEWDYSSTGEQTPFRTHTYVESAWIKPEENPFTNPEATVYDLPSKPFKIKGRQMTCEVQEIKSATKYGDWGSITKATIYRKSIVPGQVVDLQIQSMRDDGPLNMNMSVVDYGLTRKSR